MKKILSLCLMLTLCIGSASAKGPKKKTLATQVFTTDIVCHNCEQKIMNNVAVLGKGVEDVKVDVATKEVAVTYNTQKNSVENLVKGFAKISVKAEPKKAGCTQKKACCGGCKQGQAAEQKQGCCQKQDKPCEGKKAECCKKEQKACPAQGGCAKQKVPADGGKNCGGCKDTK
ncbi:MAG: cation transporter [Alloprevotella sp.]|nr:cation transporter [Alloprevotella sp.]